MNGLLRREIIVQAIIILAACVGGWMVFVEPRLNQLQELEQTIAEATDDPSINPQMIEGMANRLKGMRQRIEQIKSRNSFAGETSRVYGHIKECAKAAGVEVPRLDPGKSAVGGGSATDPVQVTGFTMSVHGTYERIGNFLDAVSGLDGFIRPVSLTLSPQQRNGQNLVNADFKCQAVRFNLPEVIENMVEQTHADG